MNRLKVGMAALALSGLISGSAEAATILVFGQTGGTIEATNNAAFGTDITGSDINVTITTLDGAAANIAAYFNLTATSIEAANTTGPLVTQRYAGDFTVTSMAGGAGTNYLSGIFNSSFTFGLLGGSGLTMAASNPPGNLSFTSGVMTTLDAPRAMALSFADVDPAVSVVDLGAGDTLSAFTSSVSGTFSAQAAPPVPEPSTMLLLGVGLIGAARAARRRR